MKRTLITESWNDPRLTLLETKTIIPFVSSIEKYITEAQLSPDQISQLFTNVEQGATAAGGNRTMIGKTKDIAGLPVEAVKFINNKINDLGKAIQNTGPVKNLDAKFADAMKKIDTSDSKVAKAVQGVKQWATDNPGKASIAVAIITTAAAMAGGPMGGAIAGFLARATKDILQGQQLSTAVGKSVKTAAVGALAGLTINYLSDKVVDAFGAAGDAGIENAKVVMQGENAKQAWDSIDPGVKDAFQEFGRVQPIGATIQMDTPTGFLEIKIPSGFVPEDVYMKVRELMNTPISSDNHIPNLVKAAEMVQKEIATNPLDQDTMAGVFDLMTKKPQFFSELTADQLTKLANMGDDLQTKVDFLKGLGTGVSSAIQGAIQAAGKKPKEVTVKGAVPKTDKEAPKKEESTQFKPIQIETIIEWCDETPAVILTEGPLDAIKKGASAVGGALKKGAAAVGAKAAKVGKNMTTKVTADKLNSAWKKAGSPTDSDEIAKILRQQGVSDEVLAPVYKQLGAKLPAAADPQAGTPGQTGGQTGKPAAANPQAGGTPQAGKPGATGGQTGTPAAQGLPDMTFKDVQKFVAKLSSADAKALVGHIDSLTKSTGSQPKAATQGQTAPAQGGQQPAQATQAPKAEPTATDTTTPAQGGAAPAADKNAAAGDTYEKAKGDIRKVQGGQKPMPPKTAATISSDLAKLAKGDKESGVAAAQKIMQFAKAGVDVSKQQQAWIANSKAGERFLTQSVYFEISKMLRENNLSWSDLGIRIHLLEGTNKMFGLSYI